METQTSRGLGFVPWGCHHRLQQTAGFRAQLSQPSIVSPGAWPGGSGAEKAILSLFLRGKRHESKNQGIYESYSFCKVWGRREDPFFALHPLLVALDRCTCEISRVIGRGLCRTSSLALPGLLSGLVGQGLGMSSLWKEIHPQISPIP